MPASDRHSSVALAVPVLVGVAVAVGVIDGVGVAVQVGGSVGIATSSERWLLASFDSSTRPVASTMTVLLPRYTYRSNQRLVVAPAANPSITVCLSPFASTTKGPAADPLTLPT